MSELEYIHCKNAGAAIEMLLLARTKGMQASYHPRGGGNARRYVPVSHEVWVMGTRKAVRKFCKAYKPEAVTV